MSKVVGEATAMIARPVQDVFAFVSDLENEPSWHTDILHIRPASDSATDTGQGSSWIATVRFMGRNDYEVEVTGFEPNRRVEITTRSGPLKPVATYLLEPGDGGTLFTRHVEIPVHGIYRIMKPLIQMMGRKRQRRFVENLKNLLERQD